MTDTLEFLCPTTKQPCRIVDGYTAFLMQMMDGALIAEETTVERIGENEDSPHTVTLEAIKKYKLSIADSADLEDFANEVTAAALVNNCSGPIDARDDVTVKAIHFMDLCPMMPIMFPEAT